jgi:hypothetical protein
MAGRVGLEIKAVRNVVWKIVASYSSSNCSKALTVGVAARFPPSVAQVCRLSSAPAALSMHQSLVVALQPWELLLLTAKIVCIVEILKRSWNNGFLEGRC